MQFLLLASLLLTVMSCGDNNGDTTDTKDTGNANNGTDTAVAGPLDFIPADVRYDGETITVLNTNVYENKYGNEVSVLKDEIVGGDIVAEAVYERNMQVSERLGVTIEDIAGEAWDKWINDLAISIQADDNAYDAVCGAVLTAYRCIPQGYLFNLKEVSSIDLSHSWWDQKEIAGMTFLDGVYTLAGDINFYDNYGAACIFFNVEMCKDNDMDTPYDAVRSGTWTIDMLNGMVKELYRDLNGDGKSDREDMFGLVSNAGVTRRMLYGLDQYEIYLNNDNYPVVNESEEISNALDAIVDLMKTVGYYSSGGDGSYAEIFTDGRAMFSEDNLAYLIKARDIDAFTVSVLPFPKYDEKQESYCCTVGDSYSSVYGIPVTADVEMVGYVLEAMGVASVDTVTESVIEKNCMVKSVRDEDSADMLRIILDSAVYPLPMVTDYGRDIYHNVMIPIGISKSNVYSSKIASEKSKIEKAIADGLELIEELQNS